MRDSILGILFLVISINSQCGAYRILGVFPVHVKSHFIMMEALMKGLARHGHTVDVVSHYPLKSPLPNYNDIIDLSGRTPLLQNNVTYDMIRNIGKTMSITHNMATVFGGDFCDHMDHPKFKKLIKNPPKDPPYDLVIIELLSSTCYLALGHHFKVPVVGVTPCPITPWLNSMVANPDEPTYVPEIFSNFMGRMNFWQRLENTLSVWNRKFEFSYYSAYQDDKIKKYIGPDAPSLSEVEKNVSLLLVNTHFTIHRPRPFVTTVVEVGGMHIPEKIDALPEDLQIWLDESIHGFVYVSFGTMTRIESFPKKNLAALYSSFAKLAPLRVLMRIAYPEELPPGLPNNVRTLPWIPQLSVLMHKHARVFITHGGLLGTSESIYSGVPMISVPFYGDQMVNTKLYVEKNIAVALDYQNITEETLNAAFDKVLGDPSYARSVKKLSKEFRDRLTSPMQTAIFWIEYVIRHGGTNLRSPALNLAWWQIAMLDIYGTLIISAVTSVYLVLMIVKKLVAILTIVSAKTALRSKKIK